MASNTSNSANNYQPTPQDVLSVKKCFLKVVPIELVDQIISYAEYWPHNTIELAEGIIARNNGEELCLQSQPLPGRFIPEGETEGVDIGGVCVRTLTPARKVVFRILSHDQGWSSSPNNSRDIYEASFTWFEAFVERPVTISAARGATPLTNSINIKDRDVLSARQSELGWKTVPISKGNTEETCERCHIQCNVRASSETKMHKVVWSWNDRPGSQLAGGSGYGGDFVRSMKAGDRVSVVARAMYPGWANHVQKMEMDIYYVV
ncbi:uncharacterized protein LAJ45_06414 [Morchella importuna]|uniref:uncharacterized protein n=1 Tax=Morchella importuna TaxID=1174673 RepID=UPI001E8D3FE4|nr:uncharacterized protein LAJ45_06414 [Morchella importuna]KAH8149335.1 hypothetical protein LAJ45_06414 [Morchella importuna]